ncbi:GxxExxY protein [Carboxylicivirga sp. N1Y90]|uniref:GxxExxY protein n=1 Tax=Carboxylicivirga fragile TaxID=3417571 RepID=UPI003D34E444|nr:hypothetical protein [Marinilabiliaceae bacterium N1Y90]
MKRELYFICDNSCPFVGEINYSLNYTLRELYNTHYSHTISYLNITKSKLGLLINFGSDSLGYRRVIV